MASGDTKTEALLDILGNGGDASSYRGCCNTKTQSYILDAIDRVQNVEDEVEELKNNPDVVDIVATYADLQAYDTQHLTDKDIIRVLQDETHDDESTYYRYNKQSDTWTYIGESKQYEDFVGTDGTTAGEAGLVPAPAITDAGKFLKADGTWDIAGGSGGGVTILASADYNYHSSGDTDDGVAVWKLGRGYYQTSPNESVKVYWTSTESESISNGITFIIGHTNYMGVTGKRQVIRTGAYVAPAGGGTLKGLYIWDVGSDGFSGSYSPASKAGYTLMGSNLASSAGDSEGSVMTQYGATAMVYADPSTRTRIRIGSNISNSSGTNNIVIGDGASSSANQGVIIGKSASGRGDRSIAIGGSATTSRTDGTYTHVRNIAIGAEAKAYGGSSSLASQGYAIAIGSNAYADYKGSIALGAYSSPASNGVMDIGSSNTTYGYNSTNYRLLSGVHDGQGLHDAATVAQGNTLATSAPTTATIGVLGQLYTDTTNMHTYQLGSIDTTDPSNPVYNWVQRW